MLNWKETGQTEEAFLTSRGIKTETVYLQRKWKYVFVSSTYTTMDSDTLTQTCDSIVFHTPVNKHEQNLLLQNAL